MATPKKTTSKAKTKTAAKKTTRKTTAKKVTRAKKTTVSSAAASSKTSTNKLLTTRMLRRLQLTTGILYAALIAPIVLLMQETLASVTVPYMTQDPLSNSGALAPAVRQLYVIDVRWILVGALIVSAIFSLLYATKLQEFYNRQIQKKQLWTRWLEIAIVSSLIFTAVVLLSGWQTIVEVKFAASVVALLAYLGYRQEKHASEDGVQMNDLQIGATLLKLVLAALIILTAASTYIWGLTTYPWYVYAAYAILAVFFVAYARHFKRSVDAPALVVERNYILISVLVRVGIVAVLVAGLLK